MSVIGSIQFWQWTHKEDRTSSTVVTGASLFICIVKAPWTDTSICLASHGDCSQSTVAPVVEATSAVARRPGIPLRFFVAPVVLYPFSQPSFLLQMVVILSHGSQNDTALWTGSRGFSNPGFCGTITPGTPGFGSFVEKRVLCPMGNVGRFTMPTATPFTSLRSVGNISLSHSITPRCQTMRNI